MRCCEFWLYAILVLICCQCVPNEEIKKKDDSGVELAKTSTNRLLLFVTLEGNINAIDKQSGELKWKITDKPIVQVPTNIDDAIIPMFLPDPRDGSLYLVGDSREPLKKLPFTIPGLVSSSPCRSSDGIMYTGKKKDIWYKLDPKTGNKEPVVGWDAPSPTCPIKTNQFVYIGRTKYSIMMVDSKNPKRKWNVTYYDYTSAAMDKDELSNYNLVHFASTSSGRLISMDRSTGQMVWDTDLGSPVVAAYILDPEGLINVPFTSLANHTISCLARELLSNEHHVGKRQMKLYPTLYVGSHLYGLYAIPSLVDSNMVTITVTGPDGPLLLGGPHAPEEPQPYPEYPVPGRNYRLPRDLYDGNFQSMTITDKLQNHIVVYTGHYNMPDYTNKKYMLSGRIDNANLITDASQHVPDTVRIEGMIGPRNKPASKATQTHEYTPRDVKRESNRPYYDMFSYKSVNQTYSDVKLWVNQQENKGLKLTLIILVGCVIGMFWYLQIQVRDIQMSQNGSRTSQQVSFGRNGNVTAVAEELPDGLVKVGKITFHPEQLLGKGCEGTFVYRGEFDSRRVAVKRLLPECFTFADREVALLRESDAHPHVIRYYCMEQDRMFRYIALELCQATLSEYVQGLCDIPSIKPLDILFQATLGLQHLHSLDIVHRDIKPHNVLLSVPNSRGQVRAMISDFGLCKKLQLGRVSFSRRSGITGTDGWIAPEMLSGTDRTTCAVDLFSLGCLYYYVLSKGAHPFGDALRRQANILSGEFKLSELKDQLWLQQLQIPLIASLISSNPEDRPQCTAVLAHPIFWKTTKVLAFLQDVSDRVEKSDLDDPVLQALEFNAEPVVQKDWRLFIHEEVARDLRKYRSYGGSSLRDLLRALRNKKHHFRELTKEAQTMLGDVPEGFTHYWTSRFPLLVTHVWITMQIVAHEKTFQNYYNQKHKYPLDNYIKQVYDFLENHPYEVSNEVNIEHFEKNYEAPRAPKTTPRKTQRISFADKTTTPQFEAVGLYRNLTVDVNEVKLSFDEQNKHNYRPHASFQHRKLGKKKKKSDEPLVWATKDINKY